MRIMRPGSIALVLLSFAPACGSVGDPAEVPGPDAGEPAPDRARLGFLSLGPVALSPEFDPEVTEYRASVGHFTATLEMSATAADEVEVSVFGAPLPSDGIALLELEIGINEVTIATAAPGLEESRYRVAIERRSPTQQLVLPSAPDGGDAFGTAVALDGDTLVVGVPFDDSAARGVNGDPSNDLSGSADSGAAYVFVRAGDDWIEEAYLKASNTGPQDRFGAAVAIAGDIIVIGAPREDSDAAGVGGDGESNGEPDSGAAYVFVREGGQWSQQAYLKASNPGPNDNFGAAVDVDADTIVVGAPGEGSLSRGVDGDQSAGTAAAVGAAYVFGRSGDFWRQLGYLKASNTDGSADRFGDAVAVSGAVVAIGAWGEDSSASGVDGDQANNDAGDAGAVYLFSRSGDTLRQEAYVKASNPGTGDRFGFSLALDRGTLVVGAPQEDSGAIGVGGSQTDDAAALAGAAYVLVRDGGSWSQEAYLKASNTDPGDQFGTRVAIEGDALVIAARLEESSATGVDGNQSDNSLATGAAYVFGRGGGEWSQLSYLKPSTAGSFAGDAAISEGSVAIGRPSLELSRGAVDVTR